MAEKQASIILPEPERIIPMNKPDKPIAFEEWRSIIREHYFIASNAAEAALSVTAQLLINDIYNPFPLVFIGPPSSGKTTVLNFFCELDGVAYTTDKFTSSAFITNAMSVKTSELSKKDLLPRIRRKVLILRDLGTIFSKRDDDLQESLGILTRVLDGEGLQTDTGPHGERGYVGDYSFMLLAASTPIRNRVWRMMGGLGSRLFFMNFPVSQKSDTILAKQLASSPPKTKDRACRDVTNDLVRTLWKKHPHGINWDRQRDPIECLQQLARYGRLLACLRSEPGTLKHMGGKISDEFMEPNIEQPDRVTNLLYNFARGHALACGRTQLDNEDVLFTLQIALDSAPPTRIALIRGLTIHNGKLTTDQAQEIMGKANQIAGREMEILTNLGICKPITVRVGVGKPLNGIQLTEEFVWLTSEQIINILDNK